MSDVYDIFGIVEDMERPLVHVHLGYSVRLLGLFPRVSLPKEKLRMVGKQYWKGYNEEIALEVVQDNLLMCKWDMYCY